MPDEGEGRGRRVTWAILTVLGGALAAAGAALFAWTQDRAEDVVRGPALAARVVPHGEFSASHPYAPYYVVPSSVLAAPEGLSAADRQEEQLSAALRAKGVSASPGIIRLELRGRVDEPVVVNGIQVVVVGAKPPVAGWFVANPGCGVLPVRVADVDLDRSPPRIEFEDESGSPVRNLTLRVSRSDVEEIEVHAVTTRDVSWRIRVFYSGPDGRGSAMVDDGGRPFRTTAVTASKGYRTMFRQGGPLAFERVPSWDDGVEAC